MKNISILILLVAGIFITSSITAQGNLTYSMDQLGYIRNPKNRTIAQYTTSAEIIRKRAVI
jgi:hypothetical protein